MIGHKPTKPTGTNVPSQSKVPTMPAVKQPRNTLRKGNTMLHKENCLHWEVCEAQGCGYDYPPHTRVEDCPAFRLVGTRTNFERIKAMTITELARFLAEPCECEVDPTKDGYIECANELCVKRLIKWLKEPSEE